MRNFLSSNIKFLRAHHNYTTKELAAHCHLKEKYIKQLETDSNDATLQVLLSLAEKFNLSIDTLVKVDLKAKHKQAKNIKLLVIDIDGVLTDGGMYYTENGDELKKFNTKDGMAIKHLTKKGIQVAFLSNGKNKAIVQNRAKLLGVDRAYVGAEEKTIILERWLKELKISYKNVAFIGDDINDLPVIKKAVFSACPADAIEVIKQNATVLLTRKGGDACVREMIDNYL